MHPQALNKLAGLGAVCGLASFFWLGFLTVRPNRLSSGVSVRIWEGNQGWEAGLILMLWASILILAALYADKKLANRAMLIAANLLIVFSWWSAGIMATRLLMGANPLSRISLGAGAWTMMLAAYIVILAGRSHLEKGQKWLGSLWIPLLIVLLGSGQLHSLSIMQELAARRGRFGVEVLQHLSIAGTAVGIGILIGVPLGIWAYRSNLARQVSFPVLNIIQTIPSLALFGLLIAPLAILSSRIPFLRAIGLQGIGWAPALIALTLYSLLPITRNAFASLKIIDPAFIEAGLGMGMSRSQLLLRVQLPLALPVIFSGIRTAAVQTIGNTALAALIGAGGLGTFIFQGIGQSAPDLILLGALPVIILAVMVDGAMEQMIGLITPKGLTYGQDD
ncbi:MAG: ABC transporter permease [Firmicutes bacterium]|nr:ABC transporter permease [Bacillota bacterium]